MPSLTHILREPEIHTVLANYVLAARGIHPAVPIDAKVQIMWVIRHGQISQARVEIDSPALQNPQPAIRNPQS